MSFLTIDSVTKEYPGGTVAVRDLTLAVGDGELLVMVGPSGCGKTTALRMVAGLEEITEGTISLDGRVINDVDEGKRDIAMVFQTYALYPHMSVADNIAFPLKLAGVGRQERARRAREVAATLQLEAQLGQKPAQLSGGQRQRVAMGRAIVRHPKLFLMDEPLSNLDAKLRVQMRGEILALQRSLGTTTLYVTHDQFEAMTLGDRVAVFRRGVLQQIGPPKQVYDAPCNLFVAGFLGSPPMNLLEVELFEADGAPAFRLGEAELRVDRIECERQPQVRARVGGRVVVGVRPEHVGVQRSDDAELRRLTGVVHLSEVLGSDLFGHFTVAGGQLTGATLAHAHEVEDPAELQDLAAGGGATVVGRFPPDLALAPDDTVEAFVSPGALRFFDVDSGLAL